MIFFYSRKPTNNVFDQDKRIQACTKTRESTIQTFPIRGSSSDMVLVTVVWE